VALGTSRELTPAQHARIRLHLALIPAYICLIWSWTDFVTRFPVGPGSDAHRVRDFAAIAYIPGLIANAGDAPALYDVDRRSTMLTTLLPRGPRVRYPPFYGPQVAVFFSPFARLPYRWALALWMLLTCSVYFVCGYAIWRVCPRLDDRAGAVLVLLLADPTLYYTLSFVQISALALICVTGGFLALRAGRSLLAGVFLGSLFYKPSMGVAVAVIFLWALVTPKLARDAGERRRDRRVVFGAIVGVAAQLALAAIFWGPSIVIDYAQAQIRLAPDMRDEFYLHHLHSWRGFFEILGLPNAVAQTAYAIAAVSVLVVAARCWRSSAPLPVRYAVLLIATVLANPHGYVYDAIILMPAYLLLWDWAEQGAARFATWFEWLIYFCYLSPLFAIVALVARVQLSVPALTVLLARTNSMVHVGRARANDS
jgi:glycosyl transferase family 87